MLIKNPALSFSISILSTRVLFIGLFLVTYVLRKKSNLKWANLITVILIYAGLTTLYKETALLNPLFEPGLDPLLQNWDENIFGFQPALKFSSIFPQTLVSEAMYFGYFSYYLMPLVILLILFKTQPQKIEEFGFIVITSFLLYYLIFILFPAVGPQFYYPSPENESQAKGIFGKIIKIIQKNGEVPSAAFPSSHVGVALLMLFWLYKNVRKAFLYFIPVVFLLILATVYIKAHYAVDAFAGILTAPVMYYLSFQLYQILKPHVHYYPRS